MTALAVERLSAWAGARRLLSDVSLTLEKNRVLAVIGPSGSGKSTFIRCLNRMHELDAGARVAGSVRVHGVEAYAEGIDPIAIRRRVGLVFQQPAVFAHLSIRDNVLVGVRLGHAAPVDADVVVERSLRRAALFDELRDRLDEPATSLSAGERQRLCIARALAVEPEILLLDEPTANLDPVATARIEGLIEELRRSCALVVVTHGMQQAIRISDDTAFLNRGVLVEHGPTTTLFSQPVQLETEEFVTGRFG
ncbi:MAG: phosphate ABC transporter ATP-binding protein [Polyangia bacterium]